MGARQLPGIYKHPTCPAWLLPQRCPLLFVLSKFGEALGPPSTNDNLQSQYYFKPKYNRGTPFRFIGVLLLLKVPCIAITERESVHNPTESQLLLSSVISLNPVAIVS